MNIVILGQQGSGKGTQAERLAQKFDLEHIDMGKTLREVAIQDTPLGREIYKIQNVTNTLVPNRILRELLHLKLGSIPAKKGIIFDGVPRTLDQADDLEKALLEHGRKIDCVLFISIPEEETIKRISKRRICGNCKTILIMGKDVKNEDDPCTTCGGKISQREDDTAEGIKKRLEVFQQETVPVINYYKKNNILAEISGQQPIEKVFEAVVKNIPTE